MDVGKIFQKIFGEQVIENVREGPAETNESRSKSNISTTTIAEASLIESVQQLGSWIDRKLGEVEQLPTRSQNAHKIGPRQVVFDVDSDLHMRVSSDKLSLQSQGTFITVKANACVFGGKWIYELQLQSKGVMQVGWCSNKCAFNINAGVGDTNSSYGYDGSKQQIWHVYTTKYGENWQSGDIIGSCLDLDNSKIEFYRNGQSMGVAFDSIEMGPGIALYPAVSLAYNESLRGNFGTSPLQYPVDGFEPFSIAPELKLKQAEMLLGYLVNLAGIMSRPKNRKEKPDKKLKHKRTVYTLTATYLIKKLAPLLLDPYVIEDKLFLYMRNLCVLRSEANNDSVILPGSPESTLGTLLSLFWTYMEEDEVKSIMKMLLNILLRMFSQTSSDLEYEKQRRVIVILTCICSHPHTRKFYLKYKFFASNCLPLFLYLRPPEYSVMGTILPDNVIWTEGIGGSKLDYLNACDKLEKSVQALYGCQKNLLMHLLNNEDADEKTPSSRKLFLVKFRKYVMDNNSDNRAFFFLQGNHSPPVESPVALSFLCILVDVVKRLFQTELPSVDVAVNARYFYDGSFLYQHFDRVGGILSHLRKVFKNEVDAQLGEDYEPVPYTQEVQPSRADSAEAYSALFIISQNMNNFSIVGRAHGFQRDRNRNVEVNVTPGHVQTDKSLNELLDLAIVYYFGVGHKHVVTIAATRDEIANLNEVLLETEQYRDDVRKNLADLKEVAGPGFTAVNNEILAELEEKFGQRESVFAKRSIVLGRKQAWYRSVALGTHRRQLLIWLLDKTLKTLKKSSEMGSLFSFVPEVYINVLPVLLDTILDFSIHDVNVQYKLEDAETVLDDAAEFLGFHAADPRLVMSSCKDAFLHALGTITCHEAGIKALENSSPACQQNLIKALLRPYENRAWGQSNWLLLRFWLGDGFAYRESRPPSVWQGGNVPKNLGLCRTRGKNESHTGLLHHVAPAYPSKHFQSLIAQVLTENEPLATSFLNSVLSQLNWAFSEFILLLQEIQNSANRTEADSIFESRQLKVCSMCFELTVSLMRALEMIITVAPDIFCDSSRANSDLILNRVCQLVSQVLSRVTVPPGCFQYVVDMCLPDLSLVTHFAIITAALGILLALLKDEMNNEVKPAKITRITRSLLTDPSFQIANIEYALGNVKTPLLPQTEIPRGNFDPQMRGHIDPLTNDVRVGVPSTSQAIRAYPPILKFSLADYATHVTDQEINDTQRLIDMLLVKKTLLSDIVLPSEDSLCPICCAKPISVTFLPCNHQSCSHCILQHLLNSSVCFFCKSFITEVKNNDGKAIYTNSNPIPIGSSEND